MLLKYLITEEFLVGNIALDDNDIRKLERTLRKKYHYRNKDLNQASEDKTMEEYLEWLIKEVEKKENKKIENILNLETPKSEVELDPKITAQKSEKKFKDEAIIDILQYLSYIWRSKDRVRAIAARFGIDSDLYMMAELGTLPNSYTDKDIWNTMDRSKKGKIDFYQSAWQPFYIESLQMLQNLNSEEKKIINNIIQQHAETIRPIHYPVSTNNPYQDVGITYECKENIVFENINGLSIIPTGTKLTLIS